MYPSEPVLSSVITLSNILDASGNNVELALPLVDSQSRRIFVGLTQIYMEEDANNYSFMDIESCYLCCK